jgi:hypothetical protein
MRFCTQLQIVAFHRRNRASTRAVVGALLHCSAPNIACSCPGTCPRAEVLMVGRSKPPPLKSGPGAWSGDLLCIDCEPRAGRPEKIRQVARRTPDRSPCCAGSSLPSRPRRFVGVRHVTSKILAREISIPQAQSLHLDALRRFRATRTPRNHGTTGGCSRAVRSNFRRSLGESTRRGCYAFGGVAPGAGCAISRSKRGSLFSGAQVGSIRSHAGEMKYGFASSESSWSRACA